VATTKARYQVATDIPGDAREEITRLQRAGASFRELVLSVVEAWRRWPDRDAGGPAFLLAIRELRWSDAPEPHPERTPDERRVRADERGRVMEWAADRLRSEYRSGLVVGSVGATVVYRGMEPYDLAYFTGRWLETAERDIITLLARDQTRYADSLCGLTGQIGRDSSIGSAYVADLLAHRRARQWAGVG
jgi:hypothetical protein